MFSVLMSVYCKENPAWFDLALCSVLEKQRLKPGQVVLVCDGPLTSELDAIIDYWVKRSTTELLVHRLIENRGLGFCLNKGLSLCEYELVARMDSDDISEYARFSEQVGLLTDNQEIDVVGSFATYIDEHGAKIGDRKLPVHSDDIYSLLWTCPIIHPSVMFRKSVIERVGSYSYRLKRRQDYDLWFRCAAHGAKFYNIPRPLVRYRMASPASKKNNVSVAWTQALIGFKGCRALSLSFRAHVGVFYPFLKAILPVNLRVFVDKLSSRFDPRKLDG